MLEERNGGVSQVLLFCFGQNANAIYSPPVRSLGSHDRQHDAHDTPERGEDDEGD